MNKLFTKYKIHYVLFIIYALGEFPIGGLQSYSLITLVGYWLGGVIVMMLAPIFFIIYCLMFKKAKLFADYFARVLATFSIIGVIFGIF